MHSWRLCLSVVVLGGIAWSTMTSSATCQALRLAPRPMARPAQTGDEPIAEGQSVFAPADRTSLLWLSDARQLLAQQRFAEAVRLLGSILENNEDSFFKPDPSANVHRSLKAEAQRLLGSMPRQGRDLYELQYGARAGQMLGEAVKTGSLTGLAEVTRRFFHTQAGYEATFLLGLHYLDHGSPLAGALTLRRLLDAPADSARFEPTLTLAVATCWVRAGVPEKARLALAELKRRNPQLKLRIAGKELPLQADQSDSLDALVALVGARQADKADKIEQWTMFRGNPARNASSSGNGPLLDLRWQIPTFENPYVQNLIDQIDQLHRQHEQGYESLPTLHPVVVNDVVLMRTVRNLLAIDFNTGKRIWEVPTDDPLDRAARFASDAASGDPVGGMDRFGRQSQDDAPLGLQLRLWGDATYGTLSSDGQLVFAVEDLDLAADEFSARRSINGPDAGTPTSPRSFNRLAAYDIRTGKLKWHIGGSSTEFALPEAGVFFLGPPLPLMGELYVMGESKGDIRLLALNAKTGAVVWSQQLAVVDRDILSEPMRRFTGASPSYIDGILVCPTANRAVVAMDLATRSLLWAYTYAGDPRSDQRQLMVFGIRSLGSPEPSGRWCDATATLAEGRVLLTPPDSNQIHCLNLVDGRLLWSQPRQDDLYLACVDHGNVVLVGRDHIRALRLKDGRPAWGGQTIALAEGSSPSGRGFTSGGQYYLPLNNAEVVAVALDNGRIAHSYKSRSGTIPGNLVAYKGHIVSQRADAVEVFYQLDALRQDIERRLAANPKDADALALRGQILWDDGQLKEAVESLRRSWELTRDSRTRELLRDALLEGLRTDFATYRQHESELLPLIEQPQQRATYLRLMASGCQAAGQFDAALDYYLKLVDLDREHRDMQVVDKSLVVRRDRWLQTQLADLRQKAPPELQARLDHAAQARLDEAVKAGSTDALKQYLDYFGSLPGAPRAQRHLLDRLKTEGHLLEAELLLTQLEQSSDQPTAASALAELAQLLRQAGRPEDAAVCYGRLAAQFADVVCQEGKTGRQLVAALVADDPVTERMKPPTAWPVGKIELETGPRIAAAPQLAYNRATVEYAGSPGPFFSNIDLEMHQAPGALVARDGFGRQVWELTSSDLSEQGNFMVSAAFMRVVVQGHLLLVTMGQKIIAIDTLATRKAGSPRIIWSRNLEEEGGNGPGSPAVIRSQPAAGFGGLQRLQLARSPDSSLSLPTAVSEQVFCYQRFHDLVAIEPNTGATLWTRHGVGTGSTVFGDRQYILIVPEGQATATVLRATDGSLVGTRPLAMQRVANIGRNVLVLQDAANARVLQLVDPIDSSQVWPEKRFAAETKLCLVDQESVAALEPDGHFVLASLDDGHTILEARLASKPSIDAIHLLQSPDGYILVANSADREGGAIPRTYPLQPANSVRINRGWVWGFSPSGQLLWHDPVLVENQQLPLSQPRRLPVLVFACMTQERRPNVTTQPKTSVLFLDKRTGWKYSKELAYATNSFQLSATPEKKKIQLQLQRNSITLTFTGQPLGPKPPEPSAASGVADTAGAIFRALGSGALKALAGPLESLSPSDGNLDLQKAAEEAIRAAEKADKELHSPPARQK